MAEIKKDISAEELTRKLIVNYEILIKNLSPKMDQDGREYIRLAVKTTEENDLLVQALKELLR